MTTFFKFEGPPLPRPLVMPLSRVVLEHTEASGQTLIGGSVYIKSDNNFWSQLCNAQIESQF